MVDDDSELEGLYRFFRCDKILPEDILSPHIAATFRRMRQVEGPVLIVHDTTDLNFGGLHAREGLGLTHGNNQGFLLHLALAVMPGEERLPLGACGMLRLCRTVSKNTRGKSTYEISKDPTPREGLLLKQLAGFNCLGELSPGGEALEGCCGQDYFSMCEFVAVRAGD